MQTKTLEQLIIENFVDKKIDWIHLDTEGMDAKILLSFEKYFSGIILISREYF